MTLGESKPTPTPKPESPVTDVNPVLDAMYRDMGGPDFYCPSFRGTRAYTEDVIRAVAKHLKGRDYFFIPAAEYLLERLEP